MLETFLISTSRLIGKPRGWEGLVRFLCPPAKFNGRESYLKTMAKGIVFPVDPATMIGWNVHFFHTYEPEVREQIKAILKPGEVAFDIGANVGWHTLLMAELVGSNGRIYAFEANPTSCERLNRAVAQNRFSQVQVDHRAMADREGELGFEAPPAGHFWDGTGRLSARPQGPITVSCSTVDQVVKSASLEGLALVKVDVEGWELSVFRGAQQTLKRFRPKIIFEYDPAYVSRCNGSWSEILVFFTGLGYNLFLLNSGCQPVSIGKHHPGCGNFLALPG